MRYGNADTKDLWAATRYGRQPTSSRVDERLDLSARVSFGDGGTYKVNDLRLSQQRFTYLAQASTAEQRWHIPIQIRLVIGDRTEHRRLLLTEHETSLATTRPV